VESVIGMAWNTHSAAPPLTSAQIHPVERDGDDLCTGRRFLRFGEQRGADGTAFVAHPLLGLPGLKRGHGQAFLAKTWMPRMGQTFAFLAFDGIHDVHRQAAYLIEPRGESALLF
jgi:hypothetical protein